MSTRVAVMGAGSWGTAYAKVLADAGMPVRLWGRRPDLVETIERTGCNDDYLPGIALPQGIEPTSDPDHALAGADLVVLAIPSQSLRDNLAQWADRFEPDSTLVSLMKGIELGTTLRMSEVIAEVCAVPADRVAVVSGPNLAKEIALEQPSATVVACPDHDRALAIQRASQTGYFRPYTSTDVVGCELAGAVKNVIALACGIAEGLGLGDNTKATLMTRGLAETARLGLKLGAQVTTFSGLAGIGDLAATCSSPLSRNRTFGERLGRGETVEQAASHSRQVAEGVKSCRSVRDLANANGVEMPITDAIVQICHEGKLVTDIGPALMGRAPKAEGI